MSPKELLYVEDALGHISFLMNQCSAAANQLTDPELKNQMNTIINNNRRIFSRFYSLV